MKPKEIQENNKLIAQFMGLVYIPFGEDLKGYSKPGWWRKLNENFLERYPRLAIRFKNHETKEGSSHYICRLHSHLGYDYDWNKLINVVIKIECTDCSKFSYQWEQDGEIKYNFTYPNVEIDTNYCEIYFDRVLDPPNYFISNKEETKIKATYKSVVEFIKWYNEKNNKKKSI